MFRIIIDEYFTFGINQESIMLVAPCIIDIFKLEKNLLFMTDN